MKKLFILALAILIGFGAVSILRADEARTIQHKFIAYTTSTSVSQSKTIFRISGVATGSPGVFGIYNIDTTGGTLNANLAVEGGEATSGDPFYMDFGPDGLVLDAGSTIRVSNCTVVIEYI